MPIASRDLVDVKMGEPVVVSMAAPEETTWGYWQFPTISRMPGGELLLTVNNTQDDDLCYGHANPAWTSEDQGQTWRAADLDEKLLTVSHSPVIEMFNNEFLAVPLPVGMHPSDMPADVLAKPVGRFVAYIPRILYPLDRFGSAVLASYRQLRGLRWNPADRQWHAQKIEWDLRGALLRLDDGGMVGKGIAPPSLEYRTPRVGSELIDVNYKLQYLHEDGSCPQGFEVICMASKDNGKSWERRGLAAFDPDGIVHPSEASVAQTTRGELICVSRLTDHRQLPLWVTFSQDTGRTWSEPQSLLEHGVLPNLEMLPNGVLLLTTGRPGVQLLVSPDGSGRAWTPPFEVLPTGVPTGQTGWAWDQILTNQGENRKLQKCGYTSMVAISPETALVAYTDIAHIDRRGRLRKALVVRPITVRRR